MKYSFLTISLALFLFISCSKDEPPMPGDNDIIYVCSSSSAKTYHTQRDCGSLKSCKEDVLEVTRRKARENERIICMNCKKKDDDQRQTEKPVLKDSAK